MRPKFILFSAVVLLTVTLVLTALLAESTVEQRLSYRFDEVKSKVLRFPGGNSEREIRVSAGELATSGDVVKTGFFARAVLSVPERACRFEIASSAKVLLAGGEPGVILSLDSGRIFAIFEKFTGEAEERRVAVPGALLVVRGTTYGVEAGSGASVTLAVFEGTVEVLPAIPGVGKLFVSAGEYGQFGPKTAPRKGILPRGMDEKSWRSHGAAGISSNAPSQQGQGPVSPGSFGRQGQGQSSSRGRN